MTKPCPPDGVYEDMPADEYHSIDAVNASTLKEFAKSGRHGLHYLACPSTTPTGAMLFGSALHTAILEPDEYEETATPRDDIGPGAEVGHRKAREESPDALILRKGWYEEIGSIMGAIDAHPVASDMLTAEGGRNELTLIWRITRNIDGQDIEIPCKARVDRFLPMYTAGEMDEPGPCIVDLKTTKDAGADGFERAIGNFGYHVQFAWYALGVFSTKLAPDILKTCYTVVAVEKSAPYAVAAYRINEATMAQGISEVKHALSRYVQYRLHGHAPHPSEAMIPLGLPVWKMNTENETTT